MCRDVRDNRQDVLREARKRKAGRIQVFFGDRHNVDAIRSLRDHCPMNTEKFPQEPLYPVAAHGVAGLAADRKTEPEMTGLPRPRQHEKNKPLGMIAPSPLVTREKLRTAHQAVLPGEA